MIKWKTGWNYLFVLLSSAMIASPFYFVDMTLVPFCQKYTFKEKNGIKTKTS